MERQRIFGLFDFMTRKGKSVFVNDFSGWGDEAVIPGFTSFSAPEGNGIRSKSTGAEFLPQYESVRRGNHLTVHYRDNKEVTKYVFLFELFPKETPVIIVTGSESLRRIAPMFKRRSEMMEWMNMVCEYVSIRASTSDPVPNHWEDDMLELVRYLYENIPDKIVDKSIYDKCIL